MYLPSEVHSHPVYGIISQCPFDRIQVTSDSVIGTSWFWSASRTCPIWQFNSSLGLFENHNKLKRDRTHARIFASPGGNTGVTPSYQQYTLNIAEIYHQTKEVNTIYYFSQLLWQYDIKIIRDWRCTCCRHHNQAIVNARWIIAVEHYLLPCNIMIKSAETWFYWIDTHCLFLLVQFKNKKNHLLIYTFSYFKNVKIFILR